MPEMRSRKVQEWEARLKRVFDEIDRELERRYAGRFPLHPARPAPGRTANPEMDGLFNVGASFSAGFGSRFGPNYVVDIRLSTLEPVPENIREEVREEVRRLLQEKLPAAFPDRELKVDEENGVLHIHGDLSLGEEDDGEAD